MRLERRIPSETQKRSMNMSKSLVAYFSAGGVTARAAKDLAEAIGADLYLSLIHI